MKQNRILLCVITFLMIFNIFVPVLYAQQPLSGMSEEERNKKIKDAIEQHRKETDKTRHPKVGHRLTELEDAYKKGAEEAARKFNAGEVLKDDNGIAITKLEDAEKKGGGDAAKVFAKKYVLKLKEGNKLLVEIYLAPGTDLDAFAKALQKYGGRVLDSTSAGTEVWAEIPIDKVRQIADEVEGINFINNKKSSMKHSSIRSEGLSKVGFSNYSAAGITGSGVKVAVIDAGFKGLSNAINNGELPGNAVKVDCTQNPCASTAFSSETDEHGTAVAEIVHDMAPQAKLYLLKINDDKYSLKRAANYCYDNGNGVKIINHSNSWYNETFYDGVCNNNDSPICTAQTANSRDILWVNSVGNDAQSHYESTYTDNGGSYHTTAPTISAKAGEEIKVELTWNAWPTTDQNYDIYLFDDGLGIAAESIDPQTGAQQPKEEIMWTVDMDGIYYLYIVKYSATSNHKFELFSLNHVLNLYNTTTGTTRAPDPYSSVSSPADASAVMAVGAINYGSWTTGPQESYSSQGPTTDGRTKPDIAGPDGVSTYTYGTNGFPGTSAAAPHVAGAAALILSKSGYSVSQLWSSLTGSAIPMLSNESNCYGSPNNCYGSGRLQLPALYNINVTKTGTGSGTVTSNITGINCGSKCSDSFISGSTVTLTASPDAGSLIQWSGACSGTGSCPLTMNGDKAVTATFYLPTLSVSKTGAGNGTITSSPAGVDCGATCAANYNTGTPVNLNVSPDTGSTFLGWSGGGCSGTGSCIITMSDSASVSTSFGVNMATCPNSVARIVGKSNYTSLQNAYNAAADGDTIQNQAVTLNENVNANRNISVTIDGGYNCYYSSNPGSTALKGSLTTSSGTVTIKNFNLQF